MFKLYVDIYRAIGSPSFEDGQTLFISVELTSDLKDLIDQYQSSDEKFGDLDFDYPDENFVEIEFTAVQYGNGKGAIFRDVTHFIDNTSSIKKGNFRSNYYIASINYLSGDNHVPEVIEKINRITEFILYLREFASISIDREQSMHGDRIFFLKPSDGKSPQKASALKINLTKNVFSYDLGKYRILHDLKEALEQQKTQIEERILIMNTAISHVLDECDNDDEDFEFLVKNWDRVKKKYLHDLQAYISAFSFDAIKKKISDGLLESTTKINNAIGEVATKLLAIPASLGALIVVGNASSNTAAFVVGLIGVIVASLIILRTIWHYNKQVENLAKSFAFNMKEATRARKTFSRSIQEEVNRIDEFQKKQKESIGFSFFFYYMVALLPIIGSLYYIFDALWPILVFDHYLYKYCLTFNIR